MYFCRISQTIVLKFYKYNTEQTIRANILRKFILKVLVRIIFKRLTVNLEEISKLEDKRLGKTTDKI